MRDFLDATVQRVDVGVSVTPHYWEFEFPVADNGVAVCYMVPEEPTLRSFTIQACLGHQLDGCMKHLADPSVGDKYLKFYAVTYPTLGQLLNDSMADVFSNGALRQFEDPDDHQLKSVIVTVVGNVDWDQPNVNSLVNSSRIRDGCGVVIRRACELEIEIAGNSPSIEDCVDLQIAIDDAKITPYDAFRATLDVLEQGADLAKQFGLL